MSASPHILLLCDAGPAHGWGHFARCSALADALRASGATASVHVSGSAAGDGEFGWDALAAVLADRRLDAVVADSYVATREHYDTLAAAVGHDPARLLVFDDFDRLEYPPCLVLNPSPGGSALGYDLPSGSTLLTGGEHVVLRSAFAGCEHHVIAEEVGQVLVSLGGAADPAVLAAVVEAVLGASDARVVCLGAADTADTRVESMSDLSAEQVASLMADCDVAVTAGGQTLLECAATGLPAIALLAADDQRANVDACVASGFAGTAGSLTDDGAAERIAAGLRALEMPDARAAASRAGRVLVDGHGAERVARVLLAGAGS